MHGSLHEVSTYIGNQTENIRLPTAVDSIVYLTTIEERNEAEKNLY